MTPALLPLTVVQLAKVSRIEEEVSSEEVAKTSPAWSEGQRSVEVEASGPVAFSSQVVACHKHTSFQRATKPQPGQSGDGRV